MRLPSSEQRTFFEQAATQYQADLRSDIYGQGYLRGRGIGPEAAATFRLGVVRTPLVGHQQYRGRLAVPYLTPSGVVSFTFRCIASGCDCGSHAKYLYPEGMDRTLFNVLDFAKPSQAAYVCEGEIDALTLSLCGFPAIGVPGVKSWKKHFTRCFKDYAQIFAVADGDEPGREFTSFLAREVDARVVRLPNGEDVNSIYTKGGASAIHQWLAGATAA